MTLLTAPPKSKLRRLLDLYLRRRRVSAALWEKILLIERELEALSKDRTASGDQLRSALKGMLAKVRAI